jgi:hypothetical protein
MDMRNIRLSTSTQRGPEPWWSKVSLAALIVLLSCTNARPAPATPTSVATNAGPSSQPTSVDAGSSTLVVRQRYRGPDYYIEGSVGFVEVASPGAAEVARLERQITGRGDRRFSLQPGTYSLTSWQRPCDGNCQDGFDPPVDGCELSFTVGRAETVIAVVTVTPGSGCTIVLS